MQSKPTKKICIKTDDNASQPASTFSFIARVGNSPHLSRNSSRPPHNGSWLHADVQLNRFHFDPPLKTFQQRKYTENVAFLGSVFGDGIVQLDAKRKGWMKTLWVGGAHFQKPICVVVQNHTAGKAIVREGQWSFALKAKPHCVQSNFVLRLWWNMVVLGNLKCPALGAVHILCQPISGLFRPPLPPRQQSSAIA